MNSAFGLVLLIHRGACYDIQVGVLVLVTGDCATSTLFTVCISLQLLAEIVMLAVRTSEPR